MIGVGVIGYGYWGPNLVRNFAEADEARLVAVCDRSSERLAAARRRYPAVTLTREPAEIINDSEIDAIAIATPVSTHADLALRCLEAGKHVLVEKPLARTTEECIRLIEAAQRRGRILMVDHTFVYTGAVRLIRELIASQQLGDIYYYDSVRVNLGLFQHDVDVLWDLAVHDLAIMDYTLGLQPSAVSATGLAHVKAQPVDVAYLTLFFDEPVIAHIHANWLAPVKVRKTLIGASRKMIVYNDLESSDEVKVYDRGIDVDASPESVYKLLIAYRAGDMWAPRVDRTEALKVEVEHFLRCITNGERPLTGGDAGLRVVQILEAATKSMEQRGAAVSIDRLAVTP